MRIFRRLLVALLTLYVLATFAAAQTLVEDLQDQEGLPPVLTHSAQDTLRSLQSLHDELSLAIKLYEEEKNKS